MSWRACSTSDAVRVPREVMLEAVWTPLCVDEPRARANYDHAMNFAEIAGFETLMATTEQTSVAVTPSELAHIVLANSRRYQALVEHYDTDAPFETLRRELALAGSAKLPVTLYYAMHQFKPSAAS